MSDDPLEGFVHNYSGISLGGRIVVLCPDCRTKASALAFQGVGLTIRPCEWCGKRAGWIGREAEHG